jgi:hypothetical protein
MISPNEFWLCLHKLAEAYEAEGLTPEHRADNIVDQFLDMSPVAQLEILDDLTQLAVHIPELYSFVVAAANSSKHDSKLRRPRNEGAA